MEIYRKTKETEITGELINSPGENQIDTGNAFFDHMLNSFAIHAEFTLKLICKGDTNVDFHHSAEDCGIVLGLLIKDFISDKKDMARFSSFRIPMDEALSVCDIDLSGRPFLVFNADFPQQFCGEYETCLTEEFFRALCFNAGITLHIKNEYGKNSHHIIESIFKAFAHAFKRAIKKENKGVLSAKGVL